MSKESKESKTRTPEGEIATKNVAVIAKVDAVDIAVKAKNSRNNPEIHSF